jgi:UDP-MurNAc hydroxylase
MIKITYITHACLLIEINRIKILTDPWLTGPSWGGSLWHYPMHNYTPSNLPTPDIIFFSHGHDDHFHEETISNFPKNWFNSKILAPSYNVSWWEGEIKKKFKNTLFLKHNEILDFKNNIKFQMFLNNDGEFDASLKIKDSNNCIFLQTDNLLNKKEALRISKIDKIDIAFVIPFLSGVFPGFYKWDTDTLIKLSNEKIDRSLNYCSDIVKFLKPKFTIPYACDLGYLGDNFHINLIHRNNKHDLIKRLKKRKIKTRSEILNSGDSIYISKDKVKFKLKNNKHNEFESLIRFSNEMSEKFQEYKIKEAKITNPNLNALTKIFVNNLKRNIKNIENFNFKVQIDINENDKKKSMLINFKTKSIKAKLKIKEKVDLKINIESTKIRNLLLTKYPMNFMTFHNGGYTCERKVLSLTNNEKKYWSWINNLDFFI